MSHERENARNFARGTFLLGTLGVLDYLRDPASPSNVILALGLAIVGYMTLFSTGIKSLKMPEVPKKFQPRRSVK